MADSKETKHLSLFDEEEEEDPAADSNKNNSNTLKIDKKYATSFQTRKQTEELRNVHWSDEDDTGSTNSDSEDEDEDAALLTEQLDVDIFKTINALRQKEDRIYDPTVNFFPHDDSQEQDTDDDDKEQTKAAKPKRYKDVVREQVLEQMKQESHEDEEDDEPEEDYRPTSRLAYDQQQEELRRTFLNSTKELDDSDSDSDADDNDKFVVVKHKKKSSSANNDQQRSQELEHELEKLAQTKPTEPLMDPKGQVQDGEAFLLDFFRNKTWTKQLDDASDNISTNSNKDNDDDDDSLQHLEKTDDFETLYNFRFEQAAATTTTTGVNHSLKSYSRTDDHTLRRRDTSRRERRLARQERKANERRAKELELKRLKNAKRQELEMKLIQVKEALGFGNDTGNGNDTTALEEGVDENVIMQLLMQGEFDPETFDQLMRETCGDQFYNQKDKEWTNDLHVREHLKQTGELLVDDEQGGLYDDADYEDDENDDNDEEKNYEEDEEAEDWPEEENEYDPNEDEPIESELEQKLKAKMEDELYKLDYEDIIAGQPTRFKYRKVEPNKYGLTTEEILFARDSTLKQFVSLKKMAPYSEGTEYFVGSRKRQRFRQQLKQDIEEQMREDPEYQQQESAQGEATKENKDEEPKAENEGGTATKKRRRIKKGKKHHADKEDTSKHDKQTNSATEPPSQGTKKAVPLKEPPTASPGVSVGGENKSPAEESALPENQRPVTETKKKRKRKKRDKKASVEGIPSSRVSAYGL
jgi:protein KRI1